MTYRQQIEKIFKKLELLAQRGDDAYMDFREYIDEIVTDRLYNTLGDVLLTKYNIPIEKYKSIDDLKKELFKEVRFQTKSKFLKSLDRLYTSKNVYSNGYHFYDSMTNKYIGDINERENPIKSPYAYQDEKLKEKLSTTEIYYLESTIGNLSSYNESIPPYDLDYVDGTIAYKVDSQVKYNGDFYDCIQSYNWKYGDPITPTYSEYWTLTSIPTYSVVSITGPDKTLLDKYSIAIDVLKAAS